MTDIDRWGLERICEMALEIAWKRRQGGLPLVRHRLRRSWLRPRHRHAGVGRLHPARSVPHARIIAREGLAGMEVVEVAPPYDVGEVTSLLGVRVINTVLGTLVEEGKLGTRPDDTIKSDPAVEAAAADEGIVGG